MKKTVVSIIIILVLAGVILMAVLGVFDPIFNSSGQGDKVPSSSSLEPGLYINEVVSSNKYSFVLDDSTAPDWIELYNNSGSAINLKGYGLTDKTSDRYLYEFPNVTIENGEYLVLLCTGTEDSSARDGYLRAGFKISSQGESLILSAPNDVTVQALEVEAMPADVSYGLDSNGQYVYFGLPTPGAANEGPTNSIPEFTEGVVSSPIVINEYVYRNSYSILDQDGERSEWVEIKNTGDEAVNIKGYGLSDDADETKKWQFPDMTLEPGQIALVFLDGKDRSVAGEELHANFGLSDMDKTLILSQEFGRSIDAVAVNPNMGQASYGRSTEDQDKWLYYPEPTPGQENTTKGFEEIEQATEKYLPDVHISEVRTNGGVQDDSSDWIELVNKGSQAVNLSGYGLSDNKDEPFRFIFPDSTTIQPGEYLLVYTKENPPSGSLSANFGVDAQGEDVYLAKADGSIIDYMNSGVQYNGMSAGRSESGESNERLYFTTPTPGQANSSKTFQTYTKKPVMSQVGGYVASGTKISITSEEGATIYYTTDGSKPTISSSVYSGPVEISKTTPLRAIAAVDGKLNSEVTTENYLIEQAHDIPVVCINSDPDGLFGYENGIMADGPGHTHNEADFPYQGANFWKDWEREISFEWFEADGTKGIEFPAGLKIYGQYSRAEAQKSVAIYLRSAYGMSEVTYPFFRDYDVTTFKSLLLRISGQDCKYTKLRDAFFSQVVKDTMDLDYMEYRPCAVYINGQYWGLYNLREKLNENYIVTHHEGTEKGSIDLIKGDNAVRAGSNEDYKALRQYAANHDLSDPKAYEYMCSRIDMDEYMDYLIAETFFTNTDSGNIRVWRDQNGENGGQYRWMLFDLDWALFPSTYTKNYIAEYFNPKGHGIADGFSTAIPCGLLKNKEWREKFIERYAWHLNNTFDPQRTEAILYAMKQEIENEMPRHIERWGTPSSVESWNKTVDRLNEICKEKVSITKQHLKEFFGLSDARMKELFPNG